ncbi:NAD(P)H-dependent oxidoreductase [Massilia sp. 9096]|uniref:NAD(P)H-dependent oxidoreductase n=1 Tax=Massilia sp. 9096 TaxID=1500894 RepID=UPI00056213F3|nr:NAD(P)H-dependent oxidoreductase [Massilia sp. 9096]
MPTDDTPHVIVLYAHPAPQRSPLMRALASAAAELPGVLVRDLYELYPDFDVDGPAERALLEGARLAVFLHPIRWYGMPSLMKEWMEVVLLPGWAYGRHGEHGGNGDGPGPDAGGEPDSAPAAALQGKGYWLVTTTGSGPQAYRPGGLHGRAFADFLPPFEQAAALCGMDWIEPLVIHGAAGVDQAAIDTHVAELRRRLLAHAAAPVEGNAHGR